MFSTKESFSQTTVELLTNKQFGDDKASKIREITASKNPTSVDVRNITHEETGEFITAQMNFVFLKGNEPTALYNSIQHRA